MVNNDNNEQRKNALTPQDMDDNEGMEGDNVRNLEQIR